MNDHIHDIPSSPKLTPPSSAPETHAAERARRAPFEHGDTLQPAETALSLGSPHIEWGSPQPRAPSLLHEQAGSTPLKEVMGNPWFAPSFLSSFHEAMLVLERLMSKIRRRETELDIAAREKMHELQQTEAKLVEALYAQQSREKMLEAAGQFASAATSAVQFFAVAQHTNQALTKAQNANPDRTTRIAEGHDVYEHNKAEITRLRREIADNPPDVDNLRNQLNGYLQANEPHQKLLDKQEKAVMHEIQQFQQQLQPVAEMIRSSIHGVVQTLSANVKLQEGTIEAIKQLVEALMQAMRTISENAAHSRDEERNSFSQLIEWIKRVTDSSTQAHLLRG